MRRLATPLSVLTLGLALTSGTASPDPLPADWATISGACITPGDLYQLGYRTDLAWGDGSSIHIPAEVFVNGLEVPSAYLMGHTGDYASCAQQGSTPSPTTPPTTPPSPPSSPTPTSVGVPGPATPTSAPAPSGSSSSPMLFLSAPYWVNGVEVADLEWSPAGTADLYLSGTTDYVARSLSSGQPIQITCAQPFTDELYIVEAGVASNVVTLTGGPSA